MCDSFIAKNFRAFKEIKIQKLAQVNLFLGKNSVGKTALLEALYIHLHANKLVAINELLVKKDEHLSDEDDWSSIESVVRHLFHNHQLSDFDKEGVVLGELTKKGELAKNKLTEIKTMVDDDHNELLRVIKDKNEKRAFLRDGFDDFDHHNRLNRPRSIFKDKQSTIKTNNNLQFVYSSGSGDIIKMWDKVNLTDKQDKVIEALQIIEPSLTGIKFVEQSRHRSRAAKASIGGKIVPFKSMGDGINRILYIVLSMVNAENGYLLIDEFENGLHYSVQKKVWEIVFSLSKYLNVQVFATTHSNDCIKMFGAVWRDNEEFSSLHRIDFHNKKHSVESYAYKNLDNALQTDTEVR